MPSSHNPPALFCPTCKVQRSGTVGLRDLFVRSIALQCGMLMRRRAPNAREECWHIHYGDVRVGTIAKRVGNPFDTDPWEWTCGFYPGSHTSECTSETSETFDQARGEFEAASAVFLSKRTEADNGAIGGIGRLSNIAASAADDEVAAVRRHRMLHDPLSK